MKIPSFRIKLVEEAKGKTLADLPEWTLVECGFGMMHSLMRFRVGDYAYDCNREGPPAQQAPAGDYVVTKVIGKIVCN